MKHVLFALICLVAFPSFAADVQADFQEDCRSTFQMTPAQRQIRQEQRWADLLREIGIPLTAPIFACLDRVDERLEVELRSACLGHLLSPGSENAAAYYAKRTQAVLLCQSAQ